MSHTNDNLVLICGTSGTGKSASLRDIENPEGVLYANCEAGKKLPFPDKFRKFTVTDPKQVFQMFEEAEKINCHTLVVDSITFLMDMFESLYICGARDTMAGWSNYQQYFKQLMQDYVAKSTKNVIFTAHVLNIMNDADMVLETKVPIKGALKNQGIEAFFSTVVLTRKVSINQLNDYANPLLNITDEEKMLGYKHVFQTKITKDTVNHRIRSSMGMWSIPETFIDNSANLLMKRLHEYYK